MSVKKMGPWHYFLVSPLGERAPLSQKSDSNEEDKFF